MERSKIKSKFQCMNYLLWVHNVKQRIAISRWKSCWVGSSFFSLEIFDTLTIDSQQMRAAFSFRAPLYLHLKNFCRSITTFEPSSLIFTDWNCFDKMFQWKFLRIEFAILCISSWTNAPWKSKMRYKKLEKLYAIAKFKTDQTIY